MNKYTHTHLSMFAFEKYNLRFFIMYIIQIITVIFIALFNNYGCVQAHNRHFRSTFVHAIFLCITITPFLF